MKVIEHKPKFLSISKEQKSDTAMVYKNKTKKYPVHALYQNLSCLLPRLKSRQEKDAISAGSKKYFLSNPAKPHVTTIKASPNNKN